MRKKKGRKKKKMNVGLKIEWMDERIAMPSLLRQPNNLQTDNIETKTKKTSINHEIKNH